MKRSLAPQESTLPQFQPVVAVAADDAKEPVSAGSLTYAEISSFTEVSAGLNTRSCRD